MAGEAFSQWFMNLVNHTRNQRVYIEEDQFASLQAAMAALSPGSLVVDADGRTILAAESGTTYSNEGASAIDPFILPAAAAGLRFGFFVQDADGIRVTAAAGDTIRVGASVSGAGGKIENSTIGGSVLLMALNATEWVALSSVGTWTAT